MARHLKIDFSEIPPQLRRAFSITRFAAAAVLQIVLLVARMISYFRICALSRQRLRQLLQQPVLAIEIFRFLVSLERYRSVLCPVSWVLHSRGLVSRGLALTQKSGIVDLPKSKM